MPQGEIFLSEAALVERFVGHLQSGRSAFGAVQVVTEWNHRSGSVDVLTRDKFDRLLAFEAKLSDWKRAYFQAYRNAAYADRVYVLLPENTVHRALKDREEFEFRGIGLCSFNGLTISVLIEPAEQDPLLLWIRKQAHAHFDSMPDERRRRNRPCSSSTVRAEKIPA